MDSSDLESSSSSSCTDQESNLSDEGNVESYLFPYQDEPLADAEDSIGTDSGEEDLDGLSPSTLERRCMYIPRVFKLRSMYKHHVGTM